MKNISPFLICFLFLAASTASDKTIILKQEKNTSVKADGLYNKQEWKKAKKIPIGQNINIYIMAGNDSLYLGIFSNGKATHYTDLYIYTTQLVNLHASMQTGERNLPADGNWTDEQPAWNWGNQKSWTASTVQYKTGVTEDQEFVDQIKAYNGQEFKIALSKTGKDFKLAVQARDFIDAEKNPVYPTKADVKKLSGFIRVKIP